MGTIDSNRNDLSKLLLIACDQSYDQSDRDSQLGKVLAPHFDSGPKTNPGAPDPDSAAMLPSWGNLLGGWTVHARRTNPDTGFGATIFQKTNAGGTID
jgi:hypothetical protein